jgi:uncharacterized protein (DUF1810 family)
MIEAVLAVSGKPAYVIVGESDDWKLRCCRTLFDAAVPDEPSFGPRWSGS